MSNKDRVGEGNPDADRRYRKGVRETVEKTTPDERAKKAREMSRSEREEAKKAEEEGKSRARK